MYQGECSMSRIKFSPLYSVLSGSTLTYVGAIPAPMKKEMERTLQEGEKLFEMRKINMSKKEIYMLAHGRNFELEAISSWFELFPPTNPPASLLEYFDIGIFSIRDKLPRDYYCLERGGIMYCLGYFTELQALILSGHLKGKCYKFNPIPEHIDLGNSDGKFDPMDVILKLFADFYNSQEEKDQNKKQIPTKSEMRKVRDYQRRCLILDKIIENEKNGSKHSQRYIAKICDASVGLVNKIANAYRARPNLSYADLGEKPRGPKPNPYSKIPKEIFDELVQVLQTFGPYDVGIQAYSWRASKILDYLEGKGIHVSLAYFYKFCQKMGLTSKAATRKNPKQDDEAVDYFTTEGFREIVKRAIKENREVVFSDETAIMLDSHLRGYSLRNTPSICSYNQSMGHSTHSLCTFIGLNGFFITFMHEGSLTTEDFLYYIEKIMKKNPRKKFLFILDNAKIHASKEAYEWYLDHEKFCLVRFIPQYAPKLNVVEYFNNLLKDELKDMRGLKNEEIVRNAARICKEYNDKAADRVEKINSLFLKEECSYAKKIYDEVYNELALNGEANA